MQLSMIGLSAHSIPRLASGNEFCVTDAKAPRLQGPNSNIYIYIYSLALSKQTSDWDFIPKVKQSVHDDINLEVKDMKNSSLRLK